MNAQPTPLVKPLAELARPAPQLTPSGHNRPPSRAIDFRIMGEHLRKASQSNQLATRLHAQGLTVDAEQQTLLTHVFLQNALSRIKPHRPLN